MILNKNRPLNEVLELVRAYNGTVTEKADLLLQYDSKELRWFVDRQFNGKWPKPIPVYKKSTKPYGMNFMTLRQAITDIDVALRNEGHEKLYTKKMIIALENISSGEAELIELMFKGEHVRGLSKSIFKKAYPQFFRSDVE